VDPVVLTGADSGITHKVPGTQASLQAVLQAVQWYSGRVVDQVPGINWLSWLLTGTVGAHWLRLRFRLTMVPVVALCRDR
jgi:hypothetical protein